ncbi:hypothetical protein [Sphingopyxis kveilinensis]|uniref:hypothetical protein n=1 Tax=Sphingopyxis kveilinensis TaxID=3114367 RepID=UPI0030D16DF3
MVFIEIYENEEESLIEMEFPSMIRVGEQISILEEDYYKYYIVKKIWYRIEKDIGKCVACAEVVIVD